MSQKPLVFSLRALCDDCLLALAPQAQARGWDLLALVYDDVPDQLLGDPQVLGGAVIDRMARIIDQAMPGELILRVLLEDLLPGRCRFRLQIAPSAAGSEANELEAELPLAVGPLPGTLALDLRGLSLVLIDPHPLAALALSHRLRRVRAQVEQLDSPATLLERLNHVGPRPDALLLALPDTLKPSETRAWLNTYGAPGGIPTLVLLSCPQQGLAKTVLESGAFGCLSRPFSDLTLCEALQALCPPTILAPSPQDRALALEIVGGDVALASELLETLARRLPVDLGDLVQGIEAGDWSRVHFLAHRLRGAASYCALLDLTRAAEALERLSSQGDAALIRKAFDAVQHQAERVRTSCALID